MVDSKKIKSWKLAQLDSHERQHWLPIFFRKQYFVPDHQHSRAVLGFRLELFRFGAGGFQVAKTNPAGNSNHVEFIRRAREMILKIRITNRSDDQ